MDSVCACLKAVLFLLFSAAMAALAFAKRLPDLTPWTQRGLFRELPREGRSSNGSVVFGRPSTSSGSSPQMSTPSNSASGPADACASRRLAFILRGQVSRYGRMNQDQATKSHLQVAQQIRMAHFAVDFFLSARANEDKGFLQASYGPAAQIAITSEDDCKNADVKTMGKNAKSLCLQSRCMLKALRMILASGVSYAFVLLSRFDMFFKMNIFETPGLLQAGFWHCENWSLMNHTYWGPWWQGRMMGAKEFYGPNKPMTDTLQLFPGHVVDCLVKFLADRPGWLITWKIAGKDGVKLDGYQRCDRKKAMAGLMFPGWFDPGIKGQSNPLYKMPGRQYAPGACESLDDFRWLPPPMATYCCNKRGDTHECRGAQRCDRVCKACQKPGECLKYQKKRKKAPDFICCGNGSLELLPAEPGTLLKGLKPDWWHEPLDRWDCSPLGSAFKRPWPFQGTA